MSIKKIIIYIIILCIFIYPVQASAVFNVGQGGTGVTSFPQGSFLFGNSTSAIGTTYSPSFSFINATSTTATSTFSGDVVIDGSVFFNSGQGLKFVTENGVSNLFTPRIYGGDFNHVTGGEIQAGSLHLGLATFNENDVVVGGETSVQGGDLGVPNEADYPGGLFGGDAYFHSGGVQTSNGVAHHSSIEFTGGKWENGLGWKGGDVRIKAGVAYLFPGGSGATNSGRISLVNTEYSDVTDAFLDISQITGLDKKFTFPNYSGTLGLLEANQTWSGNNIFNKGVSATTTVTFGQLGETTSKSCFNTKNTDGNDISFYFVGTSMVVENNICN